MWPINYYLHEPFLKRFQQKYFQINNYLINCRLRILTVNNLPTYVLYWQYTKFKFLVKIHEYVQRAQTRNSKYTHLLFTFIIANRSHEPQFTLLKSLLF